MKRDYPNDADGDALRRVVACGNDMSRPMEIYFFVVVLDRSVGRKFARAASRAGYLTDMRRDDEDDVITCTCSKTMLATYDGVVHAQHELAELSRPLGGYTDGWGTFGNVKDA
jgi:hypothetical protein